MQAHIFQLHYRVFRNQQQHSETQFEVKFNISISKSSNIASEPPWPTALWFIPISQHSSLLVSYRLAVGRCIFIIYTTRNSSISFRIDLYIELLCSKIRETWVQERYVGKYIKEYNRLPSIYRSILSVRACLYFILSLYRERSRNYLFRTTLTFLKSFNAEMASRYGWV